MKIDEPPTTKISAIDCNDDVYYRLIRQQTTYLLTLGDIECLLQTASMQHAFRERAVVVALD